jgi:hypothetical protein
MKVNSSTENSNGTGPLKGKGTFANFAPFRGYPGGSFPFVAPKNFRAAFSRPIAAKRRKRRKTLGLAFATWLVLIVVAVSKLCEME